MPAWGTELGPTQAGGCRSGVSSVLCKRPFFPCAAGILGGGKVGILLLDFHFSTAHSFCFLSLLPADKKQQTTVFWSELRRCLEFWSALVPRHPNSGPLPATPTRPAEPGRPAESQNAVRPPSSSAPAWSTSLRYAPAPGTATSAPHPQSETTLVS